METVDGGGADDDCFDCGEEEAEPEAEERGLVLMSGYVVEEWRKGEGEGGVCEKEEMLITRLLGLSET